MPVDDTMAEFHDCIVCGKMYPVDVTYDSEGDFLRCSTPDPAARALPHPHRPVIACLAHSGQQVAAALAEKLQDADEHNHDHHDEGAGHEHHH